MRVDPQALAAAPYSRSSPCSRARCHGLGAAGPTDGRLAADEASASGMHAGRVEFGARAVPRADRPARCRRCASRSVRSADDTAALRPLSRAARASASSSASPRAANAGRAGARRLRPGKRSRGSGSTTATHEDLVPDWRAARRERGDDRGRRHRRRPHRARSSRRRPRSTYSPRTGTADVRDTVGHGTFVAALAAGSVTNGEGIAGFGGDAKLMIIKAGAATARSPTSTRQRRSSTPSTTARASST